MKYTIIFINIFLVPSSANYPRLTHHWTYYSRSTGSSPQQGGVQIKLHLYGVTVKAWGHVPLSASSIAYRCVRCHSINMNTIIYTLYFTTVFTYLCTSHIV